MLASGPIAVRRLLVCRRTGRHVAVGGHDWRDRDCAAAPRGEPVMGDVESYLAVGAVLFVLGAIGFFTRRNLIVMVLSAEMMLHGVSLTLVTFGRLHSTFRRPGLYDFHSDRSGLRSGACAVVDFGAVSEVEVARRGVLDRTARARSAAADVGRGCRSAAVCAAAADALPALTPAGRVPENLDTARPRRWWTMRPARRPTRRREPPQPKEVIISRELRRRQS